MVLYTSRVFSNWIESKLIVIYRFDIEIYGQNKQQVSEQLVLQLTEYGVK